MHPHKPPLRIAHGARQEEFLESHKRLLQLVSALEGAASCEEALESLVGIGSELPAHFAEEEVRDGVFDWLLVLAPDMRSNIEELCEDHSVLLDAMRDLSLRLRNGEWDGHCRDLIHDFARQVRAHEARESEVVGHALSPGDDAAGAGAIMH
jgi:hypothetical protein